MCSKSHTGSRKRHKQLLDYPQDWYHRFQDPCFKPVTKSASYLLSHGSWLLPRHFPNLSQRDNLRAKEPDLIRNRNMQLTSLETSIWNSDTPINSSRNSGSPARWRVCSTVLLVLQTTRWSHVACSKPSFSQRQGDYK